MADVAFTAISPNDTMFKFAERSFGAATYYFDVGLRALAVISRQVQAQQLQCRTILDLPCGHGRVLRMLRPAFPTAEIYACDIDRDGVDFCASTFGVHGVYSQTTFAEIPFPAELRFDLIWVGSLVTHLAEAKTREFIRFCLGRVSPQGLVILTSAGSAAAERRKRKKRGDRQQERVQAIEAEYHATGYGYSPSLMYPDYGKALIKPDWFRKASAEEGFELVELIEGGWATQDVVVIRRLSATA